jgi:hypothetical protein
MYYMDFVLTDFLKTHSGDMNIDVINGACVITSRLAKLGLIYDRDFWFATSYISQLGMRYVRFDFADEKTLMIIKLRGLPNDG